MRDRLGPPGSGDDGSPGLKPSRRVPSWRDQVQSGLVNLGWPVRDADQAIADLEADGTVNGANGEEVNVATWADSPSLRVARVPGVHCTRIPTPPTSMTAPSGAIPATVPRT